MWVDCEAIKIRFFRNNQKKLRRDLYLGLLDAINNHKRASEIGQPVILPSSFIGGARNMYELYQDAMAIVSKFGKPDLFLTFTCNPQWPEIERGLFNINGKKQKAKMRPDLICRTYKKKLDQLLSDIVDEQIFGQVKALVWVVEFQKRGLPHAHMLIILEDKDKISTAEEIDQVISAEIPDNKDSEKLQQLVLRHMIHLPCTYEKIRKCKPGWNGQCSKRFPKPFQQRTLVGENGYPLYRRRRPAEDEQHFISYAGKKLEVDNRYVVPFNPYLLARYEAHINLEVCSTIVAVKYLYKYIYKGKNLKF